MALSERQAARARLGIRSYNSSQLNESRLSSIISMLGGVRKPSTRPKWNNSPRILDNNAYPY